MSLSANKKLMFIIPLVVFLALLTMLIVRLNRVNHEGTTDITNSIQHGKPLPEFLLPLLNEPNRIMSNVDMPKYPYLLNIWGSWCPTCRKEHPFLMELKNAGVPMIGVNYKDIDEDAFAYLDHHGDPFLYSLKDESGDFAMDLGLTGAPESYIIDSNGYVRLHIVGEVHVDNYNAQIKPCMDALAADISEDEKNKICGA